MNAQPSIPARLRAVVLIAPNQCHVAHIPSPEPGALKVILYPTP